jgi:[ribosomal protein S18]-alanine N-acetyltransferase
VSVIRDYSGVDLDRIVSLDDLCFGGEFRFDREAMLRFAEAKNAVSLVAEGDAGEVVGFVILHLEGTGGGRRGYVVTLDVAPTYRRIGLAARLLEEGERRVFSSGGEWMELHVFAGNEGAIRFYERCAYQRVRLEPGFYGGGMDAFVYQKDLRKLMRRRS